MEKAGGCSRWRRIRSQRWCNMCPEGEGALKLAFLTVVSAPLYAGKGYGAPKLGLHTRRKRKDGSRMVTPSFVSSVLYVIGGTNS